MTTKRIEYITHCAGQHEVGSISRVCCSDVRQLLAERAALLESLKETSRCLNEYRQTGNMAGWDKALSNAKSVTAKVTE